MIFKSPLLLALGILLPPAVYLGWAGDPQSFTTTVNTSDSVPTAATPAFNLLNIDGWRLSLCAPTGTTLAGDAGTMKAYLISNIDSKIYRNPDLDKTISVLPNIQQCEAWADNAQVAQLGGQLYYVTSNVLVTDTDGGAFNDGGAQITVRIDGWRSRR